MTPGKCSRKVLAGRTFTNLSDGLWTMAVVECHIAAASKVHHHEFNSTLCRFRVSVIRGTYMFVAYAAYVLYIPPDACSLGTKGSSGKFESNWIGVSYPLPQPP